MGYLSGFFNRFSLSPSVPQAKTVIVNSSTTGPVTALTRLLGDASTISLLGGTNTNLTLSGLTINATNKLANNISQLAIVRETNGSLAVEYAVTLQSVTTTAGNAVITSLSTATQSAATMRFFRATADRDVTWTINSGFTINPTTGIWSITRENAGDGSVLLNKTAILTGAPVDGTAPVTQNVALALNPIASPIAFSPTYIADLTGVTNTRLESLPGWVVSGSGANNTPVLDGSGNLISSSGYDVAAADYAVLYTPSVDLAGAVVKYTLNRNTGQDVVTMMVAASDFQNGALFSVYLTDGTAVLNHVALRQAGVRTNLPDGVQVNYKDDKTVDVLFSLSEDGNTLTVTLVGVTVSKADYDLTGKVRGNLFGFSGLGYYQPAFLNGAKVSAISYSKAMTVLKVAMSPTYSNTNEVDYLLSWAGNRPTQLQHRLYDAANLPVTDWLTGSCVVNDNGTINYTASAPGKQRVTTHFRPLNDINVVATASNPTLFLAEIVPFVWGYNVAGANAFGGQARRNNYGLYSLITPHFGLISFPPEGINGYADLQTNTGVTISQYSASTYVISSNPETGQHRINITKDSIPTDTHQIRISGTDPTFVTVKRDGKDDGTSDEWLAGIEGDLYRDLDNDYVNAVSMTPNVIPRPSPGDKIYPMVDVGCIEPYQDVGRSLVDRFRQRPSAKYWWKVIGLDYTDQMVRDMAIWMKQHIPLEMMILLEPGNEWPWNNQFPGTLRGMLDGLRYGHYGSATWNNPQPGLTINYAENSGSNTTIPVNAGDYLMCDNSRTIWKSIQSSPIGTTISESNYFTKDTSFDPTDAGRRWRPVLFDRWLDIFLQEFGAERFASQIFPLTMVQDGNDMIYQLQRDINYVPNHWDKIKGVGAAWYFGEDPNIDIYTATATSINESVRQQLDTVYFPRWSRRTAEAIGLGKTPANYEGCLSSNSLNYVFPDSPAKQQYRQLFDGYMNTDLAADTIKYAAQFVRTLPGFWNVFTLTGGPPFGQKLSFTDTTSKKAAAWRAIFSN